MKKQKNHQREDKFNLFLESVPDAMIVVGKEGEIVLANTMVEKIFGYKQEELIGQKIEILIPDKFRHSHLTHRSSYFETSRKRSINSGVELFGLRKDGTEFAAEISLCPIETADGKLVTAAIRDISERKQEMEIQNHRIQEANRLKSEFLANMSHELRTPLNAIIGFTTLIHGGKTGNITETQKEYLGDILTSSHHLLQLINDILDLAKVESGKIQFSIENVNLLVVANEVKEILRGLATDKNVKLVVNIDPTLENIQQDPKMLKQVLYNYLSNAIKFTPEKGQVYLRIERITANTFRIEVEDTGIGIKPDDIKKLFAEFQQLDSSTKKKYPGTGLGLVLTKKIVESLGGCVSVSSVFNKGSTFTAVLPCNASSKLVKPAQTKSIDFSPKGDAT